MPKQNSKKLTKLTKFFQILQSVSNMTSSATQHLNREAPAVLTAEVSQVLMMLIYPIFSVRFSAEVSQVRQDAQTKTVREEAPIFRKELFFRLKRRLSALKNNLKYTVLKIVTNAAAEAQKTKTERKHALSAEVRDRLKMFSVRLSVSL